MALKQLLTAGKAHAALVGIACTLIVAIAADSTAGHIAAAILGALSVAGVYQAPKVYGEKPTPRKSTKPAKG